MDSARTERAEIARKKARQLYEDWYGENRGLAESCYGPWEAWQAALQPPGMGAGGALYPEPAQTPDTRPAKMCPYYGPSKGNDCTWPACTCDREPAVGATSSDGHWCPWCPTDRRVAQRRVNFVIISIDDEHRYGLPDRRAPPAQRELVEADSAAKRWYEAASPYATPEALRGGLAELRARGEASERVITTVRRFLELHNYITGLPDNDSQKGVGNRLADAILAYDAALQPAARGGGND